LLVQSLLHNKAEAHNPADRDRRFESCPRYKRDKLKGLL
jgi:hypothetical protein